MNQMVKPKTDKIAAADLTGAKVLLDELFADGIRRLLLVNPPDAVADLFRVDTALRGRYSNYPPMGLMNIAAQARPHGVEVQICNLNNEILKACRAAPSEADFDFDAVWQDRLDTALAGFDPDLVGVTCMFTMTHGSMKAVAARVRAAGKPVAIGGVHVSNDVERVLDDIDNASLAFLREAEVSFARFLSVVNDGAAPDTLAQVILRDGSDARYRFEAEARPPVEVIDTLPAYDLIDVGEYAAQGTIGAFYCFKPEGTKFATVLSNRGCRAQCTFCSVRNFNGMGVRQRSISSVVDELELLQNEHGIGHVMWLDDDLLKDHDRAICLFNEIVRRGLDITWDATNGVIASSCTDEVISAAAESGCIAINIGMESGNRKILKTVKKPGTLENFLGAAEVLRRYEQIHASVFLMVGFPGETMSMILDTINVAREMDLDWYRCSQLHPLPNTPIYDAMVAQGIIQETGDKELRFNGGAFGKQAEIEQGLRLATADFKEAFAGIPMDAVPTPDQITDIWFFMNYHLNFHRIFHERNPVKIAQLVAHLNVLADVISPENGFSIYFLGYLEYLQTGRVSDELAARLERRLDTSPFWRDRFEAFGLSADHLRTLEFPENETRPLELLSAKPAAPVSTGLI
ncbi:MAG: radical SAM protein [Pseudomonadota bacterium]|nr:radical SAM protein [Pseudomonadota bacterium]